MSHGHKHADRQEDPHHKPVTHHVSSDKKWHRDWRVVLVAIVMLVAMFIYVMTMDDSMWPGRFFSKRNQPAQPVPAALP